MSAFSWDRVRRYIEQFVTNHVAMILQGQHPSALHANIISYDPKSHSATVRLQPSGIETNWMPVTSEFIGNGFGIVQPLGADDQVMVFWPKDGNNQGVIGKRLFDSRNPPPTIAQNGKPGEYYQQDIVGSTFTMTHDNADATQATGTVTLAAADKKSNGILALSAQKSGSFTVDDGNGNGDLSLSAKKTAELDAVTITVGSGSDTKTVTITGATSVTINSTTAVTVRSPSTTISNGGSALPLVRSDGSLTTTLVAQ